MADKGKSNPFWRFSLKAYARPGVAPACLALQDRHGLDVNLLLFCAWAGEKGRELTPQELQALGASIGEWNLKVVRPLREVRRWMKVQEAVPRERYGDLRDEVKRLELEAERLEQQLLYRSLAFEDGPPGSPSLVAANLLLYLTVLGVEPDVTDAADLAAVLAGACPEVPPLEAVWLLAV